MSSVAEMAAFGKLLEEHRPRLLEVVRRRLDPAISSRISAEDVLSEAFLVAQRKWADFKQQSTMSPYTWLYRITMDCLIEAWCWETRGKRSPDREMPWPEQSSVALGIGLVNPRTSPSEAAGRKELQSQMRHTLDLLSQKDRQILWMRHSDQLSFKDAAMILGIPENTATVRYIRALKRLRQLWQQLHGT